MFSRLSSHICFHKIGIGGRDTFKCISGAGNGDCALIAMPAAVMTYLQKQRTIAESGAAFNATSTADAELFINRILKIRVFNKGAFERTGRTELIFRAGIQRNRFLHKIATAKVAVTATGETMDTFDGGLRKNASGGASAALDTFFRIKLPHRFNKLATFKNQCRSTERHSGNPADFKKTAPG